MSVTHYSFEKVSMLYGALPIVGWSDGDDVITVERRNDAYDMLVGAKGDAVAVKFGDRSGTITFNLLQTSPSNAYLSLLFQTQEAGKFTTLPLVIKDTLNLAQIVTARDCMIARPANQVYGANQNARQWMLIAADLRILDGGQF